MTFFESSSRFNFLLAHDLFRKPVPTFRDHALSGPDLRDATSMWLADKDERRPGHDPGAGAHERNVGVFDLARAGPPGCLQRAFDDVPQAVNAAGAEAAAEGVEWQLAVELDAPVLDEIERLAFPAEAVGLQAIDHRGGKPVVDLRDVDILRRESGALPGQLGGAAAAFHVARQAADAPRHLEVQSLTVARQIGRPRLEIARPLGACQHDGDRALDRNIAIIQTERI